MTVHFIGAGPGAPDLLTLRGRDLIAACPVCLYAGSLVPEAILAHCPPGARIVNTAPLDLDASTAECRAAHAAGLDVARVHSGDLSVWSAMGEQLRRLRAEGIPHPKSWPTRFPDAAERWSRIRPATLELAEQLALPVENLIAPDAVRKLAWEPPQGGSASSIDAFWAAEAVRPWQRDLVVPVVTPLL